MLSPLQENLHLSRSLTALYLYDNQIQSIEGLQSCHLLTHLYLQHNLISRMENLNKLHRLTKLWLYPCNLQDEMIIFLYICRYLNHNFIRVVEGLEELPQLCELHIAYQELPEGEKLLFDPRSLKALAVCQTLMYKLY